VAQGPGGAGAVLVSTDRDAMNPKVEWSGCTSHAQADMTNNRAEYTGVITGLREAKERGWKVEVVGDSNLILRQLADYRPPRNARLRPLYCEARRLADQVQVTVWQHHLRAFNKMADAAANAAMDLRGSVQVDHPSRWPHTTTIDQFLRSDSQEWHTRHILRAAQG
jgi:ribonuclease HI